MPRPLFSAIAAIVLASLSAPVFAASERATFDIYLRGIRAASLQYAATMQDDRYAVTGIMAPSGLIAAVVDVGYEATAQGRMRGDRFRPTSFVEKRITPDGVSTASMGFRGGVPQVKKYDPPRGADPNAVDPSTQRGTVDPMTVIFAALRDQPEGKACAMKVKVYDGKRRSQVSLSNPGQVDRKGRMTCDGEYRRLKGWSADKMAERKSFPFEVTYQRGSNGIYKVDEVRAASTLGTVVLRRR